MRNEKPLTEEEKELAREAARAYKKAWRLKNKDKVKAANNRFYLKHAQKLAELKTESNK